MGRASNWISAVVTFVCGGLLGLLTTVAHRATLAFGDWPAPIGLVLGALAIVAFVGGCRLLWESRIPGVGAALGALVGQGIVTLLDGASVFYADSGFDAIDAIWTFVPAVLIVVIVVWPSHRGRSGSGGVSARG